ncbi:2-isopropylmalate synthase [Halosquirtibacter xylanolyticus]|uniref:alpha-isopropylmalate synthase regulatory domain-containing protein n=1 Tax=Halosquirtibacter xylanolyticus TaxID=3374599 RepID=UPI00374844DD|nr:2-isopropylmalate synthase [Prolixibacteraceae bacterium]
MMKNRTISIMDTTLRDGEQTSGVSFAAHEKLSIAKFLLQELSVDAIEIASARVSDGEMIAAKKIMDWARSKGFASKIEILGFVDQGKSIRWIEEAGGEVLNLLSKGSANHLKHQLRKSLAEHIEEINSSINEALSKGINVNLYLEDWSNGMKQDASHVYQLLEGVNVDKLGRVMLPDTLGILTPHETHTFIQDMVDRFPDIYFDFHAHNDYDLSVANVLSAMQAGAKGVHTTVNGLGERAGNAPLASVVALIHDHTDFSTKVEERKVALLSKMVESYSGIRISQNCPVVGENVFTQCSGVHADGDNKHGLYYNDLLPERFGRVRKYALGKTSGKANIVKNLEALGIEMEPAELKIVTDRIIDLADKKENVTIEDLPYIISDVLRTQQLEEKIKLSNYSLVHTQGLYPTATLSIEIDGQVHQATSAGDGQYDAFMNSLRMIYTKLNKPFPALIDYSVTIPPGGRTDALVETVITWNYGKIFKTRGLESDQTEAAIKATIKMLNIIELEVENY